MKVPKREIEDQREVTHRPAEALEEVDKAEPAGKSVKPGMSRYHKAGLVSSLEG